ncbi:GNAT family N-acetyltransferase [Paenibacillus sp. M1]|uniref:GNAT family N-acetyltransferase n=1 Tax=Paenibacillus haidiansis TaxID=1574488 RepID=A0ABU7VNJ6_9BACL
MKVQLSILSKHEQELFYNLYNLYLYELSSYTREDIRENGKYDMGNNYLYLEKEALFPYLISADSRIAGFVLMCTPPYTPKGIQFSIQELFLLRKYRGQNLAAEAVRRIFRLHPGSYHIEQLANNQPAVSFWKKLYTKLNIAYKEELNSIEMDGLPGVHHILSQTFSV